MGRKSAALSPVFHRMYDLASRVVRVMVEHAALTANLFLFIYFVVLPFSALWPAQF
jgi:hypothetical protein